MVTPPGIRLIRPSRLRHDVLNDGTGCGGFTGELVVHFRGLVGQLWDLLDPRMLFLSLQGDVAPSFGRLSKRHVPQNALFLSCVSCFPQPFFWLFKINPEFTGDSMATLFMVVWVLITSLACSRAEVSETLSQLDLPASWRGVFSAWLFIAFLLQWLSSFP